MQKLHTENFIGLGHTINSDSLNVSEEYNILRSSLKQKKEGGELLKIWNFLEVLQLLLVPTIK